MQHWDKVRSWDGMDTARGNVWAVLREDRHYGTNMVHMTHLEIAKAAHVAPMTVYNTLRRMEEMDTLCRVKNGRLMINPDRVWRGNDDTYYGALHKYEKLRELRRAQILEDGLKIFVGDGPSDRLLAKRAKAAEERS